jgi:DNA-3-methyladenine glycosylase I
MGSELMMKYHDDEWGVPLHDDIKIFEFMVLDAFQAGLSWLIVLKKREEFRKAFAGFDPKLVAEFGEKEINDLLNNPGIIRNKQKINATIINAQRFLKIQEEHGSFDKYIWSFTNGKVIRNKWKTLSQLPARTELSDRISKDLINHGFKFVGSTICYAFMQAMGIVNDHIVTCYKYKEL